MSFSAELLISKIAYPVRRLQWTISQDTDQLGRPNAVSRGGQLQVELDSVRAEELIDWMLSPRKKLDGRIYLSDTHSRAILKTIEFYNAFCVLLRGSFDASANARSMTKTLLISAERLQVAEVELVNHWPILSQARTT